jgi:hypothetical protein
MRHQILYSAHWRPAAQPPHGGHDKLRFGKSASIEEGLRGKRASHCRLMEAPPGATAKQRPPSWSGGASSARQSSTLGNSGPGPKLECCHTKVCGIDAHTHAKQILRQLPPGKQRNLLEKGSKRTSTSEPAPITGHAHRIQAKALHSSAGILRSGGQTGIYLRSAQCYLRGLRARSQQRGWM